MLTSIKNVFNEKEKFIVLGLCGRVGSGCSTLARILTMNYDRLEKELVANRDQTLNEKIELDILKSYGGYKHWTPFTKIKASSIITTFIIDDYANYKISIPYLEKEDETDKGIREGVVKELRKELSKKVEISLDKEILGSASSINSFEQQFKRYVSEIIPKLSNIEVKKNKEKIIINASYLFLNKLFLYYHVNRKTNIQFTNVIVYILKEYISRHLDEITKTINRIISVRLEGKTGKSSNYYSTLFYQHVGNNIRKYNRAFPDNKDQYLSDAYTSIAERINCCIKIYRHYYKNIADNKSVRIVIDSLKNPYESEYLNCRYTNYYLVAVNKDEISRAKDRKKKNILDQYSLVSDINENPSFIKEYCKNKSIFGVPLEASFTNYYEKLKDDEKRIFYWQDVESCIQHADIFIEAKTKNHSYMAINIFRYIILMLHPGIVMPTDVERCMQVAFAAKVNSGCVSRQVGATITDSDYNVKSIGWNDVPDGQIPCNYRCLDGLRNNCEFSMYSKFEAHNENFREKFEDLYDEQVEKKKNELKDQLDGSKYLYCFKDIYNKFTNRDNAAMTRALHAEERAFLELSRSGSDSVKNGYLFTTSSSCELCTKKAYHMGIKKIYYIESYPGISESHIAMCGPMDARPSFQLFSGAIGVAYSKLYTPMLPRKDEIELKVGKKFPQKEDETKNHSK